MLSLSEMEKSTITQRMDRGKLHRFQTEGKMVCSSPPFGYKKVGDDVVLDETNSKIVKLIFKLWNQYIDFPQHIRTRKITKYLEKKGITFNGKKFHRIRVNRIIKNPFYKGMLSFGKQGVTKHNYPTLVSTRMWNKVHQYN